MPALLAASLLLGCMGARPAASASSLIAATDLDRAPRPVTGAQAAADLDDAARALAEAYAGIDGEPRVPSPARLAEGRARLHGRATVEPDELSRELSRVFAAPDGHLSFGPRPRTGAPRPGLVVELHPGAVPRLAIRSFDPADDRALRELPDLARALRERPAFVVDLRGNGGGDYRYAEGFVLELTSATLRRLDEREVVSASASEGRANSARRRLARRDVPPEAWPVFASHIAALETRAAELRARGAPRSEVRSEGRTLRGRAPEPLRSRAVFLVDRGCASACEMLVALARQIPGVIIAGERTRGAMEAGELALFRLPRSGVFVSMGTRAFRDPLGDFVELEGFAPDAPLEGDAALAAAERIAGDRAATFARPRGAVRTAKRER